MKFFLLAFTFFLMSILPLPVQAMEEEMIVPVPVIKAVSFHADFCGVCKVLEPKVEEAMGTVDQDKIDSIRFDFTSKETIEETKQLAEHKDIQNILQQYGAKTGFVVLVNNQGEIVDTLEVANTTEEIAAKLAKAIASAS